jgi:hypothetical protein
MAIETRIQLNTYFETGDVPTAEQFINLIDSQINQASDNVTATPIGDGTALGLNNSSTIARLNISGDRSGNLISLYQTAKSTSFWLLTESSGLSDDIRREAPIEVKPGGERTEGSTGGLNLTHNTEKERASRLFIQGDGKVGFGTTRPSRKLELVETTANDFTGIKFHNLATRSYGWGAGHLHNSLAEKSNSFVIYEEGDGTGYTLGAERFTILAGGNVGINEMLPDTRLHVSKSLSDPDMLVDLRQGTGIAIFGPIEENITIDSQSVQARKGIYEGSTLILRDNTLNLQPLGGAIFIHSDDSLSTSARVVITETGSLGIGTTSPTERIDIDGAIKIGTTEKDMPAAGTIRWNGNDFEGFNGKSWESFTAGGQIWQEVADSNAIYYASEDAKVGIGTAAPGYLLHVNESDPITTGSPSTNSVAAFIHNTSSSDNTGITDMRVGLQIVCDTLWSSVDGPTNIGLYISDVSGQPASNENYAAILNGNVVVGDMTGAHLVGSNGTHVLAIQNGTAPEGIPDQENQQGGVQVYSTNLTGSTVSTFHVMNGNGKIVKLFEGEALTAPVTTALSSPPAYGDAEKSIIENLRTRVNQLEARLKALGLLPNT